MWLVLAEDSGRFGSVGINSDATVRLFSEKNSAHKADLVNAGVYYVSRTAIEAIPLGRSVSLERDVFPGLVGHGLCAVQGGGPFIDIGTPESYARASAFMKGEYPECI